jgi:hypothetical protein
MAEVTMRKLVFSSLIAAVVAAAVIWANALFVTKTLKARTAPPKGISVLELEKQVDVKSLPVLDVPDTI